MDMNIIIDFIIGLICLLIFLGLIAFVVMTKFIISIPSQPMSHPIIIKPSYEGTRDELRKLLGLD